MIDSLPVFSWKSKVLEGFWNNQDQQFFDSDFFFEELRLKIWVNKIGNLHFFSCKFNPKEWIYIYICVCVCVCVKREATKLSKPQNLMERKIN